MVAMLLAGGKGTRLESLTRKIAKPVVSFGGKFRIIDFPLSSIANSSIDSVGVLTQYESVQMNLYIGNGSKWGIDGNRSITTMLPPRETDEGATWYKGTADAIYQNIDWLDSLKPEYVLILSGDHIYKMDFEEMLQYHKDHKADCTIASYEVDIKEASRFGILNTDGAGKVVEFVEKPKKPISTLASMGIYIFNYKVLRDALIKDSKDDNSEHDFGKNIIPYLLNTVKKQIYTYTFKGYWKDVGTIQSLYDANMDLLNGSSQLDIFDKNLKIFSEDTHSLPMYYGDNSIVESSMINQGAQIYGTVKYSVIFTDVVIEEGAEVVDSVVMQGTRIKAGVKINHCLVSPELTVVNNYDGSQQEKVIFVNKE